MRGRVSVLSTHDVPWVTVVVIRAFCSRVIQAVSVAHLLSQATRPRIARIAHYSQTSTEKIGWHIHTHHNIIEGGKVYPLASCCLLGPIDELLPTSRICPTSGVIACSMIESEPAENLATTQVELSMRSIAKEIDHIQ